jgi:hypothetical protein
MSRAPAMLATLALLTGACGMKGPPLAPELIQPLPAENLSAIATPAGVRLTWLRPLSYSGGHRMNDLGGFTIERAADEAGLPTFTRVGTVPVEDQDRFRKERHMEWTDHDAVAGRRYLYRITAFTLDGYWSAPAGPVAVRFGAPSLEPPP